MRRQMLLDAIRNEPGQTTLDLAPIFNGAPLTTIRSALYYLERLGHIYSVTVRPTCAGSWPIYWFAAPLPTDSDLDIPR